IVSQFRNAQVKQFIEEKPDFYEAYGLVDPATKVVFYTSEDGDASSVAARALLFGSTNESQYVYAKRDGQDNVFAVDMADFNKLPTTVEDLRLKQLSSMRSWEINHIIVSASDQIFEASKEISEWMMLQPQQGKADFTSVSDLIRSIVELEVLNFVEGSLEEYGLDNPAITVELQSAEGSIKIPFQNGTVAG